MEHLVRAGEGRVLAENREGQLHLRKLRSDGWTDEDRTTFLDALAATCNVTASAEAAGKRAQSAQSLRRRDPGFAALWDHAVETGYATLEAMLVERAQQAASRQPAGAEGAADILSANDMTTSEAIAFFERYRKAVSTIRKADGPGKEGRTATAKETYLAIVERLRVLKLRMDNGE